MTVAIRRSFDGKEVTITFVLADEPEPVSVVGSFNDWAPGAHPLVEDAYGSSSVSIVVPAETEIHFRYLGSNGRWFDDPDADEITPAGSILRPPVATTGADSAVDSTNASKDTTAASEPTNAFAAGGATDTEGDPATRRSTRTKSAGEV